MALPVETWSMIVKEIEQNADVLALATTCKASLNPANSRIYHAVDVELFEGVTILLEGRDLDKPTLVGEVKYLFSIVFNHSQR